MPLLFVLLLQEAAAAQPSSYEAVWRAARAATDRGDNAGAAKMIDEALQRAGASDDRWVWELRIHRAFVFVRERNFEAVSRLLNTGFPQKLVKTPTGVRRLLALAQSNWSAKQEKAALQLIEQALPIAANHAPELLPEVVYLRANLTVNEIDAREAIRLAKKRGNPATIVRAESALAFTLGRRHRFVEAVQVAEPLAPRMEKLGLLALRKTHLGNLGWYYSELGDYDRAAELLLEGMNEAKRMRDGQEFTWAATYSNVQIIRRDWQSAAAHCEHVIRSAKKEDRARPHAFATLARAYLELGRTAEARAVLREALALEQNNEDKLVARTVEARIDRATGAYGAAVKTLQDVIAATQNPANKLAAQGQLAQTYAAAKQNDSAEKAFERAMSLVRDTRASEAFRGDQELRLFFFNTTSELYDNYVDFLVSTNQHEKALRVTETSRAQTLAEELDVPSPDEIDPRNVARRRNAVILSYWLGRDRSYVWTVTPTDIKVTPLNGNDFAIARLVEPYRRQLVGTMGTLDRIGPAGRRLYELLVAPAVQGLARGSRVIVIPDDSLHTLNFETLVVPGSRPDYWIKDVILANASSLQLLARGGAKAAAQPKMLLVGDPPKAGADFPVLPQAADEIATIARQFPGRATILSGAKATPASYTAAKPRSFDYVHFVAHGVASKTRPLDSAVILGPDPNRNYRLAARDIARQPINARLVTVSSCYGAGAATYAGEGLVGLAWAFLHAGADQVVAALWAVNDTAAPRLMDRMYDGIRIGKDPAVALREAKLALLASGTAHKHPKFWAPFVIYQ